MLATEYGVSRVAPPTMEGAADPEGGVEGAGGRARGGGGAPFHRARATAIARLTSTTTAVRTAFPSSERRPARPFTPRRMPRIATRCVDRRRVRSRRMNNYDICSRQSAHEPDPLHDRRKPLPLPLP